MRKLQPLLHDDISLHEARLKAQRSPVNDPQVLEALRMRFEEYVNLAPNLAHLSTVSTQLHPHLTVLHDLYDSEAQSVKAVLGKVRQLEENRCPYCGRPSPSTLDHFLPRSKYPEFSLFTKNLVPCCGLCNHKKLNKVSHDDGARLFLHPYYDGFLVDSFLSVSVLPDSDQAFEVPLFEFSFSHPGMSETERATCNYHFTELNLFGVLREYLGSEFRALRRRLTSRMLRVGLIVDHIREELAEEADSYAEEYGPNCWESLFFRCVYLNEDVLTYVATVPLRASSAIP